MTPCLVDLNVWLALLVRQHEHHRLARRWFDALAPGDGGLCRVVQLGLIRLLANRSILGDHAVPPAAGWSLIGELLEDERVEFLPEPAGLDSVLAGLWNYPVPTGKLVTDAYLAAFAITASRSLATLDRGFRQFHGLPLELLGV